MAFNLALLFLLGWLFLLKVVQGRRGAHSAIAGMRSNATSPLSWKGVQGAERYLQEGRHLIDKVSIEVRDRGGTRRQGLRAAAAAARAEGTGGTESLLGRDGVEMRRVR